MMLVQAEARTYMFLFFAACPAIPIFLTALWLQARSLCASAGA